MEGGGKGGRDKPAGTVELAVGLRVDAGRGDVALVVEGVWVALRVRAVRGRVVRGGSRGEGGKGDEDVDDEVHCGGWVVIAAESGT